MTVNTINCETGCVNGRDFNYVHCLKKNFQLQMKVGERVANLVHNRSLFHRVILMRPSKDRMWLNICKELATQSTCIRKAVGAVLVDDNGHILSTGWNGVAHDLPHCNEEILLDFSHGSHFSGIIDFPHKCAGAHYDSGQGLEICEAIHAEQNALLQCADVQKIHTVYVTVSPCRHCMKLIMNTSAKRVVFLSEYSQSSKDLAEKAGIQWILFAD